MFRVLHKKRWLIVTGIALLIGIMLAVMLPVRMSIINSIISISLNKVYASTLTNSPSTNTGTAWFSPTNVYADNANSAYIISGSPSGSNVWGTYGFNLAGNDITQVRVRYDAWEPIYAVAWQASGAIKASTGIDVTPVIPTHAVGDIMLCQVVVRDTDDTITWTNGWAQLATVDRNTSARYWWAWKRAASSSETNPLVDKSTTTGDTYAAITTYRYAYDINNPWEVVGTPNTSTLAAHPLNGINVLTAGSLVVASLCGEDNSAASVSYAATNPATLFERLYDESTTGSDGAVAVGCATRTTAGATGTVTATWSNTVVGSGGIVLALKPSVPNEQIKVDITWNGGTNWSSTQDTTLTSAEATYWYDVTGVTTWIPEKLANGQLQVRALVQTVGAVIGTVYLDWLPVEVTYTPSATPNISAVTPNTYDFEQVTESTTPNTGNGWFTITNDSSMAIDIDIKCNGWTHQTGTHDWTYGSPVGENKGFLKASSANGGAGGSTGEGDYDIEVLNGSDTLLCDSVGIGIDPTFELQLNTPSSFTHGDKQGTIITLTASVD